MTITVRTWCLGWLVALPLALAACGSAVGGGGGGGLPPGVVSEFQGKLSDVSAPVVVAPRYATLFFLHAFGTPPKSATSSGPTPPGGLLLDIDPVAGTVGINRASDVFPIDFDDDSQVFDSGFGMGPGSSKHATMLIPGSASGFHYTSYGVWQKTVAGCFFSACVFNFTADAFYFGSPTPSSGMPGAGQATFNGTMLGFHSPVSGSVYRLSGDATLVVDFGAKTVIGSFGNISTIPLLGSVGLSGFNDILIAATISGGSLSGTVTGGAGGSGPIEGDFFGPAASEVGGVFRMTGASAGDTVGAFAAKQ